MEYRPLGRTGLKVSQICLGSMTWGEQNTEAQAHQQLDYATANGVNFIDVAEMYPVPPRPETQGLTERCLGSWLKARGKRDDVIVATKIVGPGRDFQHIRDGQTRFTREHIAKAVDASLKRLQTDYIDLYQLHWPDRNANFFGRLGFEFKPGELMTPLAETLEALDEQVKAGKIRHIGLSNETPWGVMQCLHLSQAQGLPRVASVQNPYNLLNRSYEIGLAEVSIREECGLLAYSPLAFGVLSGKYLDGAQPEGARLTLFSRFQRYTSEKAAAITRRYVEVAREHGLDPAQMALAYVNSRPFVTSNIIGATTFKQLQTNIESANVILPDTVMTAIEAIHGDTPNPCP